jgi:hypothetical protein
MCVVLSNYPSPPCSLDCLRCSYIKLNSILNQQRNPKLKAGLGYEEGSSSDHRSNTKPMKFVKSSNIDNNHSAETKKENQPPRRNERKSTRTESIDQRDYRHERNRPPQRRQTFSRYKGFFYGYYFFCSNFGHKAINYSLRFRYEQSSFSRNIYLPLQRLRQLFKDKFVSADTDQSPQIHLDLEQTMTEYYSFPRSRY